MTSEAVVTDVLADYYRAFSTLNMEAILPYFHEPALVIGPPGVAAVPTSAAWAAIIAPLIEDLRKKGYSRSEFTVEKVTELSANAVLVSGVAIRYKTDGSELERVGISYLMHKAQAGWKIAVMVVKG